MLVELSKENLVHLVKGTAPSIDDCVQLERAGLMLFIGNQHNESWGWLREPLSKLTADKLYQLYVAITETNKERKD